MHIKTCSPWQWHRLTLPLTDSCTNAVCYVHKCGWIAPVTAVATASLTGDCVRKSARAGLVTTGSMIGLRGGEELRRAGALDRLAAPAASSSVELAAGLVFAAAFSLSLLSLSLLPPSSSVIL